MKSILLLHVAFFSASLSFAQTSCTTEVLYAGTMRDALKNGKTGSALNLDTLKDQGLFGIGPLTKLSGEITVADGKIFISTIEDHKSRVSEATKAGSPFFVYANVKAWTTITAHSVNSIAGIDSVLNNLMSKTRDDCAFPFMIKGRFEKLKFHVLDGQGKKMFFENENITGTMIGFFSKHHKGIFTHHDSNLHIHFLSDDKTLMGHVDDVEFSSNHVVWEIPD